jgi:integrase/recombinase XerD
VSGRRLGEALNLQPHDANWSESLLTIRDAKFGKSRLVPLHSSTLEVLMAYAERRDQIYAPRQVPYFFVSSHGTRLFATNAGKIFRDLSRHVGIRDHGVSHGPRLHDFRHRFTVETLLSWYRNGEQVIRRMPVLQPIWVTGTYWYLSNTPELMTAASERLEARWQGVLP